MAVTTLILRRYKVSVDSSKFPEVIGESKLQRRDRLLQCQTEVTLTPRGIPLVFTRR